MKIDIPAFKHCFIGGTSVLTVYNSIGFVLPIRKIFNDKCFYDKLVESVESSGYEDEYD